MSQITDIQTLVGAKADGIIGPATLKAICDKLGVTNYPDKTLTIKTIQAEVGAKADGILGPKTYAAIITKLGGSTTSTTSSSNVSELEAKYINKPVHITKVSYKAQPVTQAAIRSNKSIFGKVGDESNLVLVDIPSNYPMTYDGKPYKRIRCHKLMADRLEAALKDIINHYGEDIAKVAPGACVFDGCYNYRQARGSSNYSMHAWGLAIDFDAANNTMKMNHNKARFAKPIYKPFLDILEAHGLLSLGRHGDYDWMHVQMTKWSS